MDKTNSIVKKSNDLIEKSRYELTLTQQRLILYTIAHIKISDEDFKTYDIPVSELIEKAGSSDWLYSELKKEAEDLLKKTFSLETMSEDNQKVFTTLAWFSFVQYKEGSGTLQVHFDPHLKPYLLQLKERFTTYMLKYVLPMRHPHSIRIYELLKQYEHFEKQERYFDLEEFKQLLMIEEKPAYKLYGDINRGILKPAIKEINKHTDLKITKFEERKRSRKVIGFTFHFKTKQTIDSKPIQEQSQPSEPAKEPVNERLEALFLNVPEKVQTPSVKNIVSTFLNKDDDYIISNIKYASEHSDDNFVGYLVESLKNDYAKDARDREALVREKELQDKQQAKERKLFNEKTQAVSDWWLSRANEEIVKMSPEELQTLQRQATAQIKAKAPAFQIAQIPQTLLEAKETEIIKERLTAQGVKPPVNFEEPEKIVSKENLSEDDEIIELLKQQELEIQKLPEYKRIPTLKELIKLMKEELEEDKLTETAISEEEKIEGDS